jgi:hypothetical protein
VECFSELDKDGTTAAAAELLEISLSHTQKECSTGCVESEARDATSPAPTKLCRTCKKEKLIDEFARHRLSKDAHRHDCKRCVSVGRAKRQERTPHQKQAERARADEPPKRSLISSLYEHGRNAIRKLPPRD